MLFELIVVLYLFAVVACYVAAATTPRYRGPLIAVGVLLTIPAVLAAAAIVFFLISLSNGAHIG